jgi:DNA-directed RNA polymerase subunit RPC12/RpoP
MVYSYRCSLCNKIFDIEESIKSYIQTDGLARACPHCYHIMTPVRIITYPITAIYKGDGFTLRKKEDDNSSRLG